MNFLIFAEYPNNICRENKLIFIESAIQLVIDTTSYLLFGFKILLYKNKNNRRDVEIDCFFFIFLWKIKACCAFQILIITSLLSFAWTYCLTKILDWNLILLSPVIPFHVAFLDIFLRWVLASLFSVKYKNLWRTKR